MPKFKDLTGNTFSRLTVIGLRGSDSKGNSTWVCMCVCGTETVVRGFKLNNGQTRSCGCLLRESGRRNGLQRRIHGGYGTPEYRSFSEAKSRCTNPRLPHYERYGGRGIKFLFASFEQFLAEVGNKPTPQHSIERINNNGNYEPGNVCWATPQEQAMNRRPRRRTRAA